MLSGVGSGHMYGLRVAIPAIHSGQEATAVGGVSSLEDGDRIAATYSARGAAVAIGSSPEALGARYG